MRLVRAPDTDKMTISALVELFCCPLAITACRLVASGAYGEDAQRDRRETCARQSATGVNRLPTAVRLSYGCGYRPATVLRDS